MVNREDTTSPDLACRTQPPPVTNIECTNKLELISKVVQRIRVPLKIRIDQVSMSLVPIGLWHLLAPFNKRGRVPRRPRVAILLSRCVRYDYVTLRTCAFA